MDRRAFEQQVLLHQESLRRFLMNLCRGDASLSDDIAQEAFIKAYLHLHSFNGRSLFSTWLFRIAYHCFCDHHKASRRHPCVEVGETIIISPDTADKSYGYQELYLAMDALSQKERSVILLFYMEERNLKEISIIMDIPVNTVKSHLSRARVSVAEFLKSVSYER